MNRLEYGIFDNPPRGIDMCNLTNKELGKVTYNVENRDFRLICIYTFEKASTMILFKLKYG